MGTEFERTKQEICGRAVTITSWYDDNKRTWRASAPAYSHLRTRTSAEPNEFASRSAAIHQIIAILTAHFNHARK